MTSLYDVLFDDIPMFVVPGTENSDVIQYETNMQRNARLLNEARIKQQMDEIGRLITQMKHVELIGPWKQKRLPEATQYDWSENDKRQDSLRQVRQGD